MKSTANVFVRFSLALIFCLGMLVTANPVASARDRDKENRKRCQHECDDRYKQQKRECKDRRGKERHRCEQRADRERHDCKDGCRR
jgi:hypothetical protein